MKKSIKEAKYVVGIDSSLGCTGIAVLTVSQKPTIVMSKKVFTETGEDLFIRYDKIVSELSIIIETIGTTRIQGVYIEQPNTVRNVAISRMLIGLYQVVRYSIYKRFSITPFEVNTKTAKKFMTGNGNADKEEIVNFVNKTFRLKLSFHKTNKEKSDDDIADAISVAYYGIFNDKPGIIL